MADCVVRVHEAVSKKAEACGELSWSDCGFLICARDTKDCLHVVDVVLPDFKSFDGKILFLGDQPFCASSIDAALPEGMYVGGVLVKSDSLPCQPSTEDIIYRIRQIFVDGESDVLIYLKSNGSSLLLNCRAQEELSEVKSIEFTRSSGKSTSKVTDLCHTLGKVFVFVEARFTVRLPHCEYTDYSVAVGLIKSLEDFMESRNIAFSLDRGSDGSVLVTDDCHCDAKSCGRHNDKEVTLKHLDVLRMRQLTSARADECVRGRPSSSLSPTSMLSFKKVAAGKFYSCQLSLRTALLTSNVELASDEAALHRQGITSLKRQVGVLLFSIRVSADDQLSLATMVFRPPGFSYYLSFCPSQSENVAFNALFGVRKRGNFISRFLSVLPTRPISYGQLLISPHKLAKPDCPKNSLMVKGKYAYFHYGSQGLDDIGWGCAYRSLQTIYSWLSFRGYADPGRIPSHDDIQQCLVAIGDKPASFMGSKRWIGSVEVGMVIESLTGTKYRILPNIAGSDLPLRARELEVHFRKNTCPVMIGGNNLAHTILGVAIDNDTGDTQFLVADPHYKGDDDLANIIKKGWVGWKCGSFWKSSCLYNIVLPCLSM